MAARSRGAFPSDCSLPAPITFLTSALCHLSFFIGAELLHNTVLVPAVHEVNQPYVHTCPLSSGFPSHLICHSRLLQYIAGSHHLFTLYIVGYIYVNPSLPIHPTSSPASCPYICSLCLCLYFCFASKFISTIFFSRFQICTLMDDISLSVSDLFHSV